MSCCEEYGCRRREPIRLYLGDLTGRVYAATQSRPRHDRHHNPVPGSWVAIRKHDVTEAMADFIRRNPGYVRELLGET